MSKAPFLFHRLVQGSNTVMSRWLQCSTDETCAFEKYVDINIILLDSNSVLPPFILSAEIKQSLCMEV